MDLLELSNLFKKATPRIAVTTLILNGPNKVLGVGRRDQENQWGFPGGKLEPGETLKECGVRETYEETDIKLDPNKLHYIYQASDGPFLVYTYLYTGKISNNFRQMDAGPVEWITWDDLFDGPFGIYNRSVKAELESKWPEIFKE